MMIRLKNNLVIALSLLVYGFSFAQNNTENQADSKYNSYAYIDAAKIYESLLKKGYDSNDLHKKLADAYYFNSMYSEAAKHYKVYVDKSENVAPIIYFRLAKSFDASGNIEEANTYYSLFNKSQTQSNKVEMKIRLFDDFFTHAGEVTIVKELNSPSSEYPVAFSKESLLLVSNKNQSKELDPWTNKPYTSLSQVDASLQTSKSILASYIPYHEGSAAIDAAGENLYVTLNAHVKVNASKKDQQATLKIYRFVKKRSKWAYQEMLPFSSPAYNTAHPVLSKDGKTMYFASDRPGGFGSSDIYKVSINEDGSFGTPFNLGNAVNTIGRESFPQIDLQGQLVFASDGHKGYGGYDLFGIDLNAAKPVAVNLGKPINSKQDDFEFIYTDTKSGYFASNRNGSTSDDIYQFKLNESLDFTPANSIIGRVVSMGDPLAEVDLKLVDAQKASRESFSQSDGKFAYMIDGNEGASVLQLEKEGYQTKEVIVPSSEEFKSIDLGDIEMFKSISGLAKNDDLAKFFDIDRIYFNFDKWDILPKSEEDLAKIAEVLLQYPSMKIEIRSHTDQLGTKAYNQVLSEKRAKSTFDHLVKLGVNPQQMTAKGYGETQLAVECNGCSIEKRMVNRRSEFTVKENN